MTDDDELELAMRRWRGEAVQLGADAFEELAASIDRIEQPDAIVKSACLGHALGAMVVRCSHSDRAAAIAAAHLIVQWAIDHRWDGFEDVRSHLDATH